MKGHRKLRRNEKHGGHDIQGTTAGLAQPIWPASRIEDGKPGVFQLDSVAHGGGGEFINSVFLGHVASCMPGTEVYRSRPSRPNDNCRVEQKNGSILRPWLRQWRLDDAGRQKELDWIAEKLEKGRIEGAGPAARLNRRDPKEESCLE